MRFVCLCVCVRVCVFVHDVGGLESRCVRVELLNRWVSFNHGIDLLITHSTPLFSSTITISYKYLCTTGHINNNNNNNNTQIVTRAMSSSQCWTMVHVRHASMKREAKNIYCCAGCSLFTWPIFRHHSGGYSDTFRLTRASSVALGGECYPYVIVH